MAEWIKWLSSPWMALPALVILIFWLKAARVWGNQPLPEWCRNAQPRDLLLALLVWLGVRPDLFLLSDQSPPWVVYGAGSIVKLAAALVLLVFLSRRAGVILAKRPQVQEVSAALKGYGAAFPLILVIAALPLGNEPQDQARRLLDSDSGIERGLMALMLIVATPLYEEVFYRRLLFGGLLVSFSRGAALLTTTALFTLVHFPPQIWPGVFALGLVLGVLGGRSGSLWPCVLVHAIHNALTFVFYLTR